MSRLTEDLHLIRDAIREMYGGPCEDYNRDCKTCRAWSAFYILIGIIAPRREQSLDEPPEAR